jgi:hypothetical protein
MDLPFLIIPDVDGQSFSFIYNDSSKVPKAIKNVIVLQNWNLRQRMATVPLDTLFE